MKTKSGSVDQGFPEDILGGDECKVTQLDVELGEGVASEGDVEANSL
jgi:hypothetical protein